MIRQEVIANVIDSQREIAANLDNGIARESILQIPIADSFATIITGIRRCGKSTLLLQLLRRDYIDAIYLNFDDIRVSAFEKDDFIRLDKEIKLRGIKVIFFDEIQVVKGWEEYINQLLREGYKVFITGSNASLLSVELGTYLTGRHLSMELFPFSYTEYLKCKGLTDSEETIISYLKTGGIPEYVKNGLSIILTTLTDDIVIKDIAIRHSVRDINSLRQLTAYLISNIGNLVSANKLAGMFDIKSVATFLEFFSYLKDAYLLDFIPQFSHSLKIQTRNPKKIYVLDMGIYSEISLSTSKNMGRRLENLVFIELRRKYKQIYYYKNREECDFIAMDKGEIVAAIQVCLTITDENFMREYNGLMEPLNELNLSQGVIVTLNQSDEYTENGKTIKMIPIRQFIMGEY